MLSVIGVVLEMYCMNRRWIAQSNLYDLTSYARLYTTHSSSFFERAQRIAEGNASMHAENTPASSERSAVHRSYPLAVSIVVDSEAPAADRYQFVAPDHVGRAWPTASPAELYADVYFDTNGFVEAETGSRGVPPEVIQAGRDTLAAYLLTHDALDRNWVASYFGKSPAVIDRYVEAVQQRAEEIRTQIETRDQPQTE